MTRDELLSDLAYARAVAEEGRQAPLIGGSFSVLFGVLLAICYGAQYAVLMGWLDVAPNLIGMIWMGFGVCAFAGSAVLNQRVRKLPGGTAVANRVDRVVWQGVMIAILVVVAGTILRSVVLGDYLAPNAIVASGFGLYGVAIYSTAILSGRPWLRWFAVLAWCVSGVLWFFIGEPWVYAIASPASIAVLVAPGLISMQQEPTREIV